MHRLYTVYSSIMRRIAAFLYFTFRRYSWYRRRAGGVWYYVRVRFDMDVIFYWTRNPVPMERICRIEDFRPDMIRYRDFLDDGSYVVPLSEYNRWRKESVKVYGPYGE